MSQFPDKDFSFKFDLGKFPKKKFDLNGLDLSRLLKLDSTKPLLRAPEEPKIINPSSHETRSMTEWADPKLFQNFEANRGIVRDASRLIVHEVTNQYIPTEGNILELGSGIGELLRLAPASITGRLIGVEQSLRSLQEMKRLHPDTPVVVGNILALPFVDKSAESAISFSVFDTIFDLGRAASETGRVLKSGGTFVHFLDLQPHGDTLIDSVSAEMLPFPNMAKAQPGIRQQAADGFQLVLKDDYPKLRSSLDAGKRPLFDAYFDDPSGTFRYLYDGCLDIFSRMAQDVTRSGLVRETIPTFRGFFNQRLADALANNGFEIIDQADKSATLLLDKTAQAMAIGDYNDFHNEVGALHKFRKDDIGLDPNKMTVKSTLSVTVARKR